MHNVGNHAARVWMNQGFDNGFSVWASPFKAPSATGSPLPHGITSSLCNPHRPRRREHLSQENEVELFGLGDGTIEHVRCIGLQDLWRLPSDVPYVPSNQSLLKVTPSVLKPR